MCLRLPARNGTDFFTKNRVKTALRARLQFLVAKMGGVAVAHDEFRGMGFRVRGFMDGGRDSMQSLKMRSYKLNL